MRSIFVTCCYIGLVAAVVALSGCAGLNVQWTATATYNTPAVTTATMNPGAILPPLVAASGAKP